MESRPNQSICQQHGPSPRLKSHGNSEGLSNVFGSQKQRLFRAAFRLLGNTEDAEDAVQEGLLAALRNVHRFEGRAQLSTWLERIVVNAALMRLRTLRAHETASIDDPIGDLGFTRFSDLLVDGRPSPEEVCAWKEQRQILYRGLQFLSTSHQRALALHDLLGLGTQEAADELGLSVGTVKSQVHRARRKLTEHVQRIQQHPALSSGQRQEI
jgi:RNA polymerase sigma-70 factor, ECF subfamily